MTERPRTSPIMMPMLDAVSGRSYGQSNQTAGALGGRRNKEEWFSANTASSPDRKIVKTAGGVWRLLKASARVRVAPTVAIGVDILAQVPGASSPASIFSTVPVIAVGQTEAAGGVISNVSKLLPVGTLLSTALASGIQGIVAAIHSVSDGKTATLRYVGGAWTKQSEDATAWPTAVLKHFTGMGNVLFRCRSNGDNYDGWLTLQRSPDLGVNWNDTTVAGCPDITMAPNGDLYAIGTGGDGQPHRIYRSVDGGLTWTEVYNDTTGDPNFSVYRCIAADPADSDHVVVAGWEEGGGNDQLFLVSNDATSGVGATYTRSKPTMTDKAEKNDMSFCFGQSSRLLWAYEDWTGAEVKVDTSDNNGAVWTARLNHASIANEEPRTMFLAGTHVYLLHAAIDGAMRSPDNGITWNSFPDTPSRTDMRGFAVDVDDAIYIGQGDVGEPNTVMRMQPIDTGGSWVDISSGLKTLLGFSDVQLCHGGLWHDADVAVSAEDLTTELHYRVRVVAQ